MSRPNKKLVNLIVDRFVNLELFNKQQRTMSTGCIEWTGVTSNIGYGFIGFRKVDPETGGPLKGQGGMMTVHRLAWMIANNRLPIKRNINHTCHNKLCVNPDHLTEGTQQEKMQAMRRDGIKLGNTSRGSRQGPSLRKQNREYLYSEAEIQWTRTASSEEIAKRYGLSKTRASSRRWSFRKGYAWLPLPDAPEQKQKPGRKPKQIK